MTIAELLRTEGWQQGREEGRQEGWQQGREEGRMVGTIQELQGILGLAVDSTASLTPKNEGELVVQLDLLKAEVRQRLR
jgi:flagellar biosynthesis/type III secretory pathway protein FliH